MELLAVPIWEYPEAARRRAGQRHITPTRALIELLNRPVHISNPYGPVQTVIPVNTLASTKATADEYMASYRLMFELGRMDWDADSRIHYRRFPHDQIAD